VGALSLTATLRRLAAAFVIVLAALGAAVAMVLVMAFMLAMIFITTAAAASWRDALFQLSHFQQDFHLFSPPFFH
jgi:hypothetical protein